MYEETEGETGTYKGNHLIVNTKDPAKFEKVYADACKKLMEKCENKIEEELSNIVRTTTLKNVEKAPTLVEE